MSGDLNPPQYSSVNVDIDTIQGPVTIDRTVIGFIDNLESMKTWTQLLSLFLGSTLIAEDRLGKHTFRL